MYNSGRAMRVTKDQQVAHLSTDRPHVVLVGAGASYATCPNGDATGKPLPLMCNLIELLDLGEILAKAQIEYVGKNFEDVYAALYDNEAYQGIRADLERHIYGYFASLELPDSPTIYDHMVLALRDKDVVTTFNWDPFLVQAFRRNVRFRRPRLIFLHGNVMIGYCEDDKVMGINGCDCTRCGRPLAPTGLLYPITQKNYESDRFIREQWTELAHHMKEARLFTIFGYGAPKSDVAATRLLRGAWGSAAERSMEEIEIINTLPEEELAKTWSPFIHSHHYTTTDDFYSSWLANHPRRTGEAYIKQFLDCAIVENNPLPKDASFPELWEWFGRLAAVEKEVGRSTT
jgi:hypothetical protein